MTHFAKTLVTIVFTLFTHIAFAQEAVKEAVQDAAVIEKTPEVGKHVMANVDASSMILSLFMVLAVIIISALVLKRFNFVQQNTSQLKVITSLSLGAKERVVVVQVGEQQLVLGVTSGQITLIDTLAEPLETAVENSLPMSGNVLAFLQKANLKKQK